MLSGARFWCPWHETLRVLSSSRSQMALEAQLSIRRSAITNGLVKILAWFSRLMGTFLVSGDLCIQPGWFKVLTINRITGVLTSYSLKIAENLEPTLVRSLTLNAWDLLIFCCQDSDGPNTPDLLQLNVISNLCIAHKKRPAQVMPGEKGARV
jgi:hypothetical protein